MAPGIPIRPRPWLREAALVAFLSVIGPLPLASQATLGGSVRDPDDKPIVGAVVTVRPLLDTALRIQVETDERGRFRMENFNPSRGYRFHVAKEGYRTEVRDVEAGLGGISRDGVLEQQFTLFPIGVNPTDKKARLLVMTRQSAATGPYQRGLRAFERGDWERARSRLEEARALDADLAPVHEALALVYHRLGEYEAGLEAADRALALSPWDPDYLRIRYEALNALGRSEEARRTLDKLARAAADKTAAVLFHNDGVAAKRRGDLETAETMLWTALRLDPEMLETKDALAKVYVERRKYESALALSAEVLAARPSDVELLRLRQVAWSALGRTEEALAALAELERHDPGPRTATLVHNQGVKAYNSGDLAAAESIFVRALALDPDHLEARLGLAEVYLQQERYAECLAETDKVEALSPGNSWAVRTAERARARMAD